jgi:hypothetical protein
VLAERNRIITRSCNPKFRRFINWTSHTTVDKLKPQIEARSNASGLTPPRWLWRRVRL